MPTKEIKKNVSSLGGSFRRNSLRDLRQKRSRIRDFFGTKHRKRESKLK